MFVFQSSKEITNNAQSQQQNKPIFDFNLVQGSTKPPEQFAQGEIIFSAKGLAFGPSYNLFAYNLGKYSDFISNFMLPPAMAAQIPATPTGDYVRKTHAQWVSLFRQSVLEPFKNYVNLDAIKCTYFYQIDSEFSQAGAADPMRFNVRADWVQMGIRSDGTPFVVIDGKSYNDGINGKAVKKKRDEQPCQFDRIVLPEVPSDGIVLAYGKREAGNDVSWHFRNIDQAGADELFSQTAYLEYPQKLEALITKANSNLGQAGFEASFNCGTLYSKDWDGSVLNYFNLWQKMPDDVSTLDRSRLAQAVDFILFDNGAISPEELEHMKKMLTVERQKFYTFANGKTDDVYLVRTSKLDGTEIVVDASTMVRGFGQYPSEALEDIANSGFGRAGIYSCYYKGAGQYTVPVLGDIVKLQNEQAQKSLLPSPINLEVPNPLGSSLLKPFSSQSSKYQYFSAFGEDEKGNEVQYQYRFDTTSYSPLLPKPREGAYSLQELDCNETISTSAITYGWFQKFLKASAKVEVPGWQLSWANFIPGAQEAGFVGLIAGMYGTSCRFVDERIEASERESHLGSSNYWLPGQKTEFAYDLFILGSGPIGRAFGVTLGSQFGKSAHVITGQFIPIGIQTYRIFSGRLNMENMGPNIGYSQQLPDNWVPPKETKLQNYSKEMKMEPDLSISNIFRTYVGPLYDFADNFADKELAARVLPSEPPKALDFADGEDYNTYAKLYGTYQKMMRDWGEPLMVGLISPETGRMPAALDKIVPYHIDRNSELAIQFKLLHVATVSNWMLNHIDEVMAISEWLDLSIPGMPSGKNGSSIEAQSARLKYTMYWILSSGGFDCSDMSLNEVMTKIVGQTRAWREDSPLSKLKLRNTHWDISQYNPNHHQAPAPPKFTTKYSTFECAAMHTLGYSQFKLPASDEEKRIVAEIAEGNKVRWLTGDLPSKALFESAGKFYNP